MLGAQGKAGLFLKDALKVENLSLARTQKNQGLATSTHKNRLLLKFCLQLVSEGALKEQLASLLNQINQTSSGKSFSELLQQEGINRHALQDALPSGVGDLIFNLACESKNSIFCEDLYALVCDLETSWSDQGKVAGLLSLLSDYLNGLPNQKVTPSLRERVQTHLGLFNGKGSLSQQVAFGSRQFVYDKRNAATLVAMAGGMTAFNLSRLAFVARGASALRAGAQAFVIEGAAFSGFQLGAEAALQIINEQSLGQSLVHAYGMMGMMRGAGLLVGTLTQPLQPLLRHSSVLNYGVKTVAPRMSEFVGLTASRMVLEGQDLSFALRSAATGVVHFAALRALSHGLAPGLAAFNHSLQQRTQTQLYRAGSAWLRAHRQSTQLHRSEGWNTSMEKRFGVLGPKLSFSKSDKRSVLDFRDLHLSYQIGGGGHDGYKVKGRGRFGIDLDFFVEPVERGTDGSYAVVQKRKLVLEGGEVCYEIKIQQGPGGQPIFLQLNHQQFKNMGLDVALVDAPAIKINRATKKDGQMMRSSPGTQTRRTTSSDHPPHDLPREAPRGASLNFIDLSGHQARYRLAAQSDALPPEQDVLASGILLSYSEHPKNPNITMVKIQPITGGPERELPIHLSHADVTANPRIALGHIVKVYSPDVQTKYDPSIN